MDNPGGDIRAIDLFADGTVSVVDIEGTVVARNFINVAPAFRWVVQVRRVNATGTSLTNAQMEGLH